MACCVAGVFLVFVWTYVANRTSALLAQEVDRQAASGVEAPATPEDARHVPGALQAAGIDDARVLVRPSGAAADQPQNY